MAAGTVQFAVWLNSKTRSQMTILVLPVVSRKVTPPLRLLPVTRAVRVMSRPVMAGLLVEVRVADTGLLFGAAVMVKLRSTGVAAVKFAFPACVALSVQVPTDNNVSRPVDVTAHVDAVIAVIATGSSDVEVAEIDVVSVLRVRFASI